MKYSLIAKTSFLTTNDGNGHLAAEEGLNVAQYQIHLLMDICNLNTLNPELNPTCHLLALLGAHHILHVSGIRVKVETWCRFLIGILHARKEYRYIVKIPQIRQ